MRQIAKRVGRAGERVAAFVSRLARQRRAVAEYEARFRDFACASGDWFWETDAAGRYAWVSPEVREGTGRTPDWYLGRDRLATLAREADAAVEPWRSHRVTLQRREPFRDFVYRRDTPAGRRWISTSGVPRFDYEGRFLGYRGSARDVSDRVQMEGRAQAAEELLQAGLDHLSELIVLTDAQDRIVYANRSFRELNAAVVRHLEPGTPYDAHLRAGITLGLFPDAIGREEPWLAERLALRRNPDGAVERRRQDGKWLLVSDRLLRDGGVITFGLDITERKRAEQVMRVEHAIALALSGAATAVDGIEALLGALCEIERWDLGEYWEKDAAAGRLTRRAVWMSPQWPDAGKFIERSADWTFGAGEGLPGTALLAAAPLWVPDLQADTHFLRGDFAIEAGMRGALLVPVLGVREAIGVLMFVSRQVRRPDQWLRQTLETVGVQLHQFIGRKHADDELRRANEELEQRVEARTAELRHALHELESFSYTVSHDLRTPARAVAGFTRIVLEDFGALLPEEGRRLLERISKAGLDMGAMVDGLLELSRITRAELQRQPVDIAALATEVWRELAAIEPGQAVELHVDPGMRADGDPVLLRNLLANLLSNARKYTRGRSSPAAWLGSSAAGEYFVRDNGVGFDVQHAGKLFRAFHRLHTEREFEGHGIGLALARRIVERHGGRIRAEAAPGAGATFYFTLGGAAP